MSKSQESKESKEIPKGGEAVGRAFSATTNPRRGETPAGATYTDKLIKYICENLEDDEDISMDEIVQHIKTFSNKMSKKMKNNAESVETIYFGKYKGKKIKEIATFDKSYLLWLKRQSFVKDNMKKAIEDAISPKDEALKKSKD